jgi:FAD/FMN-containing dehydrogenase
MGETTIGEQAGVEELRDELRGAVIGPADAGYDDARTCFNALIDRRPAAIARCLDAADVATALAFGREQGLEIAVRGGGHNPAGHCICDGGLVIDLTLMNGVEVDPGRRIARSGGGATWLDFDTATQTAGLATPGGVVGTTGVAGLTFGGGIGHLTAQHGLTCDHLLDATVVTADGSTVRAGEDGDPELLWGLRGAGGNFGVATALEFRLHRVDRVVGGRLVVAGPAVRDALRRFRDLVATDPPDLSCAAVLGYQDDVGVVAVIAPCFTGDGESAAVDELRALPGVVRDTVRRHSFVAQQHVFGGGYGEDRNYWKGHFVRELPDELIDLILERMNALGRNPGQVLIESLHGAPKRTEGAEAALGFRHAAFNVTALGVWIDPALDEEEIAWTRGTAAALEPWSATGGGYVNYMQADEPVDRVRAAFGDEAFERLRALKRRYDPANLLHRNQNVPPDP